MPIEQEPTFVQPRELRAVAIDDETIQREGQARLSGPGFRVVGTYPDVESFLDDSPEADVVLLDLWIRLEKGPKLPLRGLPAVQKIASRGYKILIYTSDTRREVLARLLRAGALGVVIKTEPTSVLLHAIPEVGAGRVVLTTELTGLADLYKKEGLLPELTDRQAEVLRWRARGLSVKEIARRLHVVNKTVEKHITETNFIFRNYLQRVDLAHLDPDESHSAAVLARTLGYGPDDLLYPSPAPD